MQEIIKLLIGTAFLILGIPIGNYLARITKEELLKGQIWFKRIIILSLIGVVGSLIMNNDILLFSFAFIAIVTSRSIQEKKKKKHHKKRI